MSVALEWSDWHARRREAIVASAMAASNFVQPWTSRWVSGWMEVRA